MQVAVLASAVTALSAFIKNIGALAIFIPIAMQVARRTEKPVSRVLMPLAFGSLLGGLITLIGTSPNIVVSQMREQITGEPFRMFDFAPVGIGLSVVGVAFLTFGWRLLPTIKRGAGATPETRFSIEDYITEVASAGGLPVRRSDCPRPGRAGRWRRHRRSDRPRELPALHPGRALDNVRGRHPRSQGRYPRALEARRRGQAGVDPRPGAWRRARPARKTSPSSRPWSRQTRP